MGMSANIRGIEVKITGMLAMAMKVDCKMDLDSGIIAVGRRDLALVLVAFRDRINKYTISGDDMYQDTKKVHLATKKLLVLMDYFDSNQSHEEDLIFA